MTGLMPDRKSGLATRALRRLEVFRRDEQEGAGLQHPLGGCLSGVIAPDNDIGRTGVKFAWHRRLRTFGHRLLSGLQRLGYQLVRDPIWWEALRRRRP